MGERIYFATSNWKDKPDKPSCLSQGEWDAMHSSKFNGTPFAGKFALTDEQIKSLNVKGYEQGDFDAYKNAVKAITLGTCPPDDCWSTGGDCRWIGDRLREDEQNLPELKEKDIKVKCEDIQMKVWDGSTYYDRSGASKLFTWNTCNTWGGGSSKPTRYTVGIRDFKAPSARSDVYIPVCGPGTHILEISKDQLMQIVWKISQFDLEASGVSAEVSIDQDWKDYQGKTNGSLKTKATAKTSNKDLDPEPKSPGKESEIVNLNWTACERMGYSGDEQADGKNVKTGTSNGNVTASNELSPSNYADGLYTPPSVSSYINISIKPFSDRHQYIYFVTDPASGIEKSYFDPTGLLDFGISCNGVSYTLDPANILAEHSVTLSALGQTYTIYVQGMQNDSFTITNTKFNYNFDAGSTITLTANKYYPYANSKGEDVYNTETGEQLKDPVS